MNELADKLQDKVYHGTISTYKDSLTNGININRCNDCVDFVYGSMADAQIATLIEDVRLGKATFNQFCNAIEPFDKYNQDQLSFHTNGSIKCLSLYDFIVI